MSRASERAYNNIRSMILSGELQPGSQIREEALAELCGGFLAQKRLHLFVDDSSGHDRVEPG